jgi:thiamine kinase-like enzyme
MPLQPENALDSWRRWSAGLDSRPEILRVLRGGRSNRSFLLDSDIGKLVLRINGAGSLLPDSNRGNEIRIWQTVSNQGIAPPLLFVDAQYRYLVSTYINNDLPANPQSDPATLDQAFKLLATCHQLDADAPNIDYAAHIEHYWQLIEASNNTANQMLLEQREAMQVALESLISSNTPTGLCHHDPVIENFVGSPDHLYLIDWEYAANGLQIMDYAALATEWQIDDITMQAKTGLDRAHLKMAKPLYKYLCSLWQAAT